MTTKNQKRVLRMTDERWERIMALLNGLTEQGREEGDVVKRLLTEKDSLSLTEQVLILEDEVEEMKRELEKMREKCRRCREPDDKEASSLHDNIKGAVTTAASVAANPVDGVRKLIGDPLMEGFIKSLVKDDKKEEKKEKKEEEKKEDGERRVDPDGEVGSAKYG